MCRNNNPKKLFRIYNCIYSRGVRTHQTETNRSEQLPRSSRHTTFEVWWGKHSRTVCRSRTVIDETESRGGVKGANVRRSYIFLVNVENI